MTEVAAERDLLAAVEQYLRELYAEKADLEQKIPALEDKHAEAAEKWLFEHPTSRPPSTAPVSQHAKRIGEQKARYEVVVREIAVREDFCRRLREDRLRRAEEAEVEEALAAGVRADEAMKEWILSAPWREYVSAVERMDRCQTLVPEFPVYRHLERMVHDVLGQTEAVYITRLDGKTDPTRNKWGAFGVAPADTSIATGFGESL